MLLNIDDLLKSLRSEILINFGFYAPFVNDISTFLQQLEEFSQDPLKNYNTDTGDIFLMALGNHYNVNVVIMQSNEEKCWTTDLADKRKYTCTLHFARSLSLHFDPIVLRYEDSNSECSELEIVKEVPGLSNMDQYVDNTVKEEKGSDTDHSSDSDVIITGFQASTILYNQTTTIKTESGKKNGKPLFYTLLTLEYRFLIHKIHKTKITLFFYSKTL